MTLYSQFGVPVASAPLETLSQCLFHLDVANIEWDASTGLVVADSGHTAAFTRGSSTASPVDSDGTSYTAQYRQPAYECRDWLNAGGRQTFGMLFGANDRLPFGINFVPRAMGGYAEFIEVSGGATFCLSNAAVSGARLVIDQTAGKYRVTHHNGTSSVVATMATGPSVGQRVRLRWQLNATGSVQIWQSLNEAAETNPSASGTLALASAWASSASLYVNALGTGTAGAMWLRRLKYVAGTPTLDTLQTLR